jgi:hypothetical protein
MKPRTSNDTAIRNPRIEGALARAIERGDTVELFDLLTRMSGVPGPRPNLDLARSVATTIAASGAGGARLIDVLLRGDHEYLAMIAALSLGERIASQLDAKRAMGTLHDMAEDPRHHVRQGVILALRIVIARQGDDAIRDLAAWTDGYLHAHVVLEALSDRELLTALRSSGEVMARLDEAFTLADESPRAAERTQGLRTLRRGLPDTIRVLAARFPEVLAWLNERAASKRPETREVIADAIRVLRRGGFGVAEADRLSAVLEESAKPPRDPSRIVTGTRKRSKGRR